MRSRGAAVALNLMPLYAVIVAMAVAVPLLAAASVNPFDALHDMLDRKSVV